MRRIALTILCLLITTLLMFEEPASAWAPVNGTRYHKQGFMAVDPFVGCDLIVAGPMHLTLKMDYLCALSESKLLPNLPLPALWCIAATARPSGAPGSLRLISLFVESMESYQIRSTSFISGRPTYRKYRQAGR